MDDFLFLINEVKKIDNVRDGVEGVYAGDENVTIISRNESEIVARNNGIIAEHRGSGDMEIQLEKGSRVVSEEGDAIFVKHRGTGSIESYIEGEVRGGNTGILANVHNKTGGIFMWVFEESEVSGSTGIKAHIDDYPRNEYGVSLPIVYTMCRERFPLIQIMMALPATASLWICRAAAKANWFCGRGLNWKDRRSPITVKTNLITF